MLVFATRDRRFVLLERIIPLFFEAEDHRILVKSFKASLKFIDKKRKIFRKIPPAKRFAIVCQILQSFHFLFQIFSNNFHRFSICIRHRFPFCILKMSFSEEFCEFSIVYLVL